MALFDLNMELETWIAVDGHPTFQDLHAREYLFKNWHGSS